MGVALGAVPAFAQSQDAPPVPDEQPETADSADVATIVVTGRGLRDTPAAPAYGAVRLDREDLVQTASGRIEDALATVAGVQQFRRSGSRSANPSAQGITLRALGGNATSRSLVLLDGVPVADPFFGFIPFNALAPERLESAVVTRGGGSGPFGAGALAGTVELTSAGAAALGLVQGGLLADSRGATELSVSVTPELGNGFVTVSGRWDRGQGFWTTPPAQRVPASVRAGYANWSVQLRGVAPLSDTLELQARFLSFRDERVLRFAGADSLSEGQDASIRVVSRGPVEAEALAYVQARNFANVVISATRFTPTLDQRSTPATGAGGKVEVRPMVGRGHLLRLGTDYRLAQGDLAENALNVATGAVTEARSAGGRTGDLGLFAEHDWTSGPVVLTAGVRADRYVIDGGFFQARTANGDILVDRRFDARRGWQASYRAGALVRVGGAWRLRAALYTGLRLPTLNELYRPFVVFPVTTQANAELRNERLRGYEFGAEYRRGGVSLSATAFSNRVADAVANVTVGTNLRQRQNVAAIHARGIEAEAGWRRGAFSLEGSLALTDARIEDQSVAGALDGRRPAQTPAWTAVGTLRYAPASGGTVAATLRHVGAQFEDDLETDRLPPATVLDLYAEWPLSGDLAAVARLENLTDERIVTRNQNGSIDLGVPRTLWLGVRFGR